MSDTPRTDYAIKLWVVENPNVSLEKDHVAILCRKLERELNSAVSCINAIEAHYKAKHGESYDHTTLHTIIENWRNK